MAKQQYTINNINKLYIGQKEVISRMIIFRDDGLTQNNNEAHINNIGIIDNLTIDFKYSYIVSCIK